MSTNRTRMQFLSILLLLTSFGWAHSPFPADSNSSNAVPKQTIRIIDLPSNDTSYSSVLKPPVSAKIRSGFVTLAANCTGEEHSTEGYEEMIVVISGNAILQNGDQEFFFAAGQVAYVPPHTKHLMKNNGTTTLKYLYIVAKTE